jgi:hypothetical protein
MRRNRPVVKCISPRYGHPTPLSDERFRRRKPSERRNTGAGDRTQREDSGMATGLYLLQDGTIMVAYGERKIPIGPAQYKANGYKPPFEKLKAKSSSAEKPLRAEYRPRERRPAH